MPLARSSATPGKVPVIIDNQVGASGSLGAARVAKAAPDGYTLLILSSTYTINSAVTANLPFDPKASFAPVAMLGKAPMMLAASKTLPVRNAKELIALARAKPGALNYGSAGVGSVNHMAMELLKSLGGLDIKHVPYRAGNAAVNDLIGGHLDMFVGSLPQMIELVRSGSAIGIAVTGPQRSVAVADLPTLAESGVPGYELEQWWGIVVPAGYAARHRRQAQRRTQSHPGDARDHVVHGPRGRRPDAVDPRGVRPASLGRIANAGPQLVDRTGLKVQ